MSKFKYGSIEISPFSQVTGGGPIPDGPPGATFTPYTPIYSNQGLCDLETTILYKYMNDNLPVGFDAIPLEQDTYEENYKKRHIKLLHPKLLIDLYDEFRFLMTGNIPRGTTRIIEFKG